MRVYDRLIRIGMECLLTVELLGVDFYAFRTQDLSHFSKFACIPGDERYR